MNFFGYWTLNKYYYYYYYMSAFTCERQFHVYSIIYIFNYVSGLHKIVEILSNVLNHICRTSIDSVVYYLHAFFIQEDLLKINKKYQTNTVIYRCMEIFALRYAYWDLKVLCNQLYVFNI